MTNGTQLKEEVERSIRMYITGLRESRPTTKAEQLHYDQMLTWAVGLMGAGLVAFPTVFKEMCAPTGLARFAWAATPWAGGIVIALVARLAMASHRKADDLYFFEKWQHLEALLIQQGRTPQEVAQSFLNVMRDEEGTLASRLRSVKRRGTAANWLYYVSHLCFIGGLLTVAGAASCC